MPMTVSTGVGAAVMVTFAPLTQLDFFRRADGRQDPIENGGLAARVADAVSDHTS